MWKGADSHEGFVRQPEFNTLVILCTVEQLARQLDARQLDARQLDARQLDVSHL